MPHVRWLIIGLVFLATVINYLDRLTISVLAPVITKELNLSNLEFAQVGVWFLAAYTFSQALSGRLYDRIGSKRGFTASVIVWSSAAAATATATTVGALSACRFVLGLGEAGNWPGAAKVVAEWFPVRERAFAMAIFNSGAALGAVISPPIIVWLQLRYGWQAAFLVTASLGFGWLVLWLLFYHPPDRHPMMTAEERALIAAGAEQSRDAEPSVGWGALLGYRQVWAIVLARFMVDPIWWLYITWLPKYLSDARGFSLAQIGLYAWVPYLAADAGSLTGGALSGYLISRGWSVDRARKTVIAAAALLMPAGILAVRAESAAVALALMCVVLFAFQVWINNVQTLPSDFFPSRAVGSVAGLGGFGAGLGSMLFTLTTGWVVDHFSYTPIFTAAGLLGPIGTIVLFALSGRVGRLPARALVKSSAVVMLIVSALATPAFAQANAQTNSTRSSANASSNTSSQDEVPTFEALLAHPIALKPELAGVHPRVFVTAVELDTLRQRARTTHREEWTRALADLPALKGEPPPPPGPQARRSQNNVAFGIVGVSLAWAVEQKPEYRDAAKRWMLAAIDYEPWGYTFNKPNVDLAAGHLLYAIGWAYDLLYHDLTEAERARVRASLERHAGLVYDYFRPGGGQRTFNFTQNHNFIPTAGLAVTALALMGESTDAPKWAALARAHHHRAGQLLSPDGYYYEGMEYWIFSAPWLVQFLDAWEHSTGESLWSSPQINNWKYYLAHVLLPDGQNVFDFGDIWEGPLTRARKGAEYDRVYPGGTLQSNFNALYRVAARLQDREAQAVAARYASFKHSNLEEYMTLLWRDPKLEAAPMTSLPLVRYFDDSGVVFARTSWESDATAFAFKAGPPEGHRVARLLPRIPEWKLSSGHAHPDANSFIIWARGRYLTGDTGYSGLVSSRQHNTITVGGAGQGVETDHDVWKGIPYETLAQTRMTIDNDRFIITGDATSSYPASANLKRFTRTFTFRAPDRFIVEDVIETSAPQVIESYLHTDEPVRSAGTGAGGSYQLGGADVWLDTKIVAPEGSRIEPGTTQIRAPGPPGSIEKGAVEQRGFELKVTTPPATSTRITMEMVVKAR
jgi:sugar phosphate permease